IIRKTLLAGDVYCRPPDKTGIFFRSEANRIFLLEKSQEEQKYYLGPGAKVLDPQNAEMNLDKLNPGDIVSLTMMTDEMVGSPDGMAKALASTGHAEGYVTVAFNDHPDAGALPVSLEIIKITCPLYQGELKAIEPPCVFDEQLTLRHTGDLAGKSGDYVYEWRTLPDPGTGSPPEDPLDMWDIWDPDPAANDGDTDTPGKQVAGALDTTIRGAGLFTLSDNWFIMRYKKDPSLVNDTDADCVTTYSQWTEPMLAEGWIKRVMGKIDPFKQRAVGGGIQTAEDRFLQYQTREINTIVSMLAEAGRRFNGDVALNCETIDNFGLLEIYETVLRRGIGLSIEGIPPVDYPPANHALVLCAGRISDLYLLIANEAFADALDPTIALGTDHAALGTIVTSIFCFMDQMPTLLDEEMALLRGRDVSQENIHQVQVQPVYNRLWWNFTGDIVGGEVAYALNYDIRDESGNIDGVIGPEDAAMLYPQGHGDAWGHYLTAIKTYYTLLRHPHYTWSPHAEAVLVSGEPVAVNYLHERKFAEAARARARAGAEITGLTYRSMYSSAEDTQWKGYKDSDPDRAWGVYEWGARAGQGAYFDWVAANAVIPSEDKVNEGIAKVDRTTVSDIREIAASYGDIQTQINNANGGLNPLGLASNVIPFDIEPAMMDPSPSFPAYTQFDQIYMRAVSTLKNAMTAFDYANGATQELRKQADDVADFQQTIRDQEFDFNCRLIEIFGTPYPEDMGPGKLYVGDYDGPDYIHFMYADVARITGEDANPLSELKVVKVSYDSKTVKDDGDVSEEKVTVQYNFDPDTYTFVKPDNFTRRKAQGEIQMAIHDVELCKRQLQEAVEDYENKIDEVEVLADLIEARYDLNKEVMRMKWGNFAQKRALSTFITIQKSMAIWAKTAAHTSVAIGAALTELVPENEIFGLADGGDIFSPARASAQMGYRTWEAGIKSGEAGMEIAAEWAEFAKETISESIEISIEGKELD
ncbi:MAG TPA: hypothetical protein PLB62_09370, partial [Candidatus Sumerlaeota bacterium]|nr:hypothetical protein [Candidatus Sumerlaeota bacterium]